MPGVPGAGGPVPKRESQRRRNNKPAVPVTKARSRVKVKGGQLPPDPGWHVAARQWYESLALSGQSAFYEASDWGSAWVLAESMSRELNPQPLVVGAGTDDVRVEMHSLPPKGASLSAWLKGFTSLMVTEGDRRRLRLELERPGTGKPEEAQGVSKLDDFRARLRSPAG